MPIYEYECLDCGFKFDYLVRSENDTIVCPQCNRKKLKRLVSTFSFKSKSSGGATLASSSSRCSSCASRNCASCGG